MSGVSEPFFFFFPIILESVLFINKRETECYGLGKALRFEDF
jgi:hypothetical protein